MDLMDDEDLKKSVIGQMMGELDDVTANSLKKSGGPTKGVEIAITVSPKTDEEMPEGEEACMEPGCEDPMHDHTARDAEKPEGESDYISELMKKMG